MPPSNEEIGRVVGEAMVAYSVRELLTRIEERIVRLDTRSELAATKDDMSRLAERIDRLESARDKLIGFSVAAGLVSGGLSGWIATLLKTG